MINITIIGFGYVGTSITLLLLNNKHALRLNVMEPDLQREGAFLDLAHGMSLFAKKELIVNDEDLFLNADFIFFTAGTPNIHGSSRLSTAKRNIQLSKDIFESKKFVKTPYIIVITNPVDIIAHSVCQYSGLPPEKVIGTGTFLDSIRLAYYLSNISNYKVADFEAFVLGEHGSSQVPIYSMCKLKGKPLLENSEFDKDQLKLAANLTRDAAFQIRETQEGTTYGVAKCAEVLLDYLLGKSEHSLTLSMLTNEHYRTLLNLEHNIYISQPVTIKNGKIEINNQISFSDDELDAYRKSAALLAEISIH
jgi:L-lactate dehydrogenase